VSPIERVKLIFQTSSEEFTYRKGINMFKEILRTEGFLSLWRGNTLVALRIFPYSAIQFAVYDTVKHVSILIYLVKNTKIFIDNRDWVTQAIQGDNIIL
jgi:Mitochondrial carrier protein